MNVETLHEVGLMRYIVREKLLQSEDDGRLCDKDAGKTVASEKERYERVATCIGGRRLLANPPSDRRRSIHDSRSVPEHIFNDLSAHIPCACFVKQKINIRLYGQI